MEYKQLLAFRVRICCLSNETRALIANLPPNSAQMGRPYRFPSYIRVCAVVWECGEGQTHRTIHTDQYTFRVVYDSREI